MRTRIHKVQETQIGNRNDKIKIAVTGGMEWPFLTTV